MKSFLYLLSSLICTSIVFSSCPSVDLTQDCKVDFEDFAVFASDWLKDEFHQDPNFMELASQWLTRGVTDNPALMPFVYVPVKDFHMGVYEVTNGQYVAYLNAAMAAGQIKFVNSTVYAVSDTSNKQPYIKTQSCQINYSDGKFTVRNKPGKDMANYPVTHVYWDGAKAFCDFYNYRLPDNDEWKYAARGGLIDKLYPWGDTISHDQANYKSSASYPYDISPTRGYHPDFNDGIQPYTAPVGSFAPNGYGLYDMSGNVWEYGKEHVTVPHGPIYETFTIIHGGSWSSNAYYCQIGLNIETTDALDYGPVGFRCVLNSLIPVPDLTNMPYTSIYFTIQNSRFEVGQVTGQYSNTVPAGKVISQDPAAGTMLLLGKTIDVVFSLGSEPADITWVDIPAGTFEMGDSFGEGDTDELPVHTVSLSGFKMSAHEITNGQYVKFLNDISDQLTVIDNLVYHSSNTTLDYYYVSTHRHSKHSQIDHLGGKYIVLSKDGRDMSDDPVSVVTWYGAKAFCDYYGYRLPTEEEWEYAARGGLSDKRFPWGDTINHDYANYAANGSKYDYDTSPYSTWTYHPSYNDGIEPYTAPVGSFAPNGYGLYDMSGNIAEWCYDCYNNYGENSQCDPQDPDNTNPRIFRGGDWYHSAFACRVANRAWGFPWETYGFRCVKDF